MSGGPPPLNTESLSGAESFFDDYFLPPNRGLPYFLTTFWGGYIGSSSYFWLFFTYPSANVEPTGLPRGFLTPISVF